MMLWPYRLALLTLSPLVALWMAIRLLRGKEDGARFGERLGKASVPRPQGKLVWLHGASVGETVSLLPVVDKLLAANPKLHVLVTSGTRTSAALMAQRLPKRAFHQYVPLDLWPVVRRFMKHWQPDVSVFVESEFWPDLLYQAPNPVLIGARVSARAFRRYRPSKRFWRPLIARFTACHAQTNADADRLSALGARNVAVGGNLKFDAPPPPADPNQLEKLQKQVGKRPVWCAASTHNPEELLFARTHQAVAAQKGLGKLLTIIAPRHPGRGAEVAATLRAEGYNVSLRSAREAIGAHTQIYVADSLGEMGLWYTLADVVVIGGSFIPHGGQNPLEALKCHAATLCGPYMHNFTEMVHKLTQGEALMQVKTPEALALLTGELLRRKAMRNKLVKAAEKVIGHLTGATGRAAALITRQLKA